MACNLQNSSLDVWRVPVDRVLIHRYGHRSCAARGRCRARQGDSVERSGPSIETKVVALVAAVLIVQDVVLLVAYTAGASAIVVEIILGGLLALGIVTAAVWGNAVARAARRLTRACYVARKGDTRVLAELTRTDELGQLNNEINRLVEQLRELNAEKAELSRGADVSGELERSAPELARSAHDLLVSLKELREGASAEASLLRKLSASLGEARLLISEALERCAPGPADDAASRLGALEGLSREIDLLADRVVDEVARPDIDEATLARAINGLRDAARTMSQVASQASFYLEGRRSDLETLRRTGALVEQAEVHKSDGSRVAELMEKSAGGGLNEATRLAALVRRLGAALQTRR
jgi:HAMP domain-containing protein